jgi:hypothetical protein
MGDTANYIVCPRCQCTTVYNIDISIKYKDTSMFITDEKQDETSAWIVIYNIKKDTGVIYINYKCKNNHRFRIEINS